ncbi:unnamed protein product [Caenorhabditis brenneri]
MPFLFALVSINVLSVSLILVMCGKKENENSGSQSQKPNKNRSESGTETVQIAFSTEALTPSNYERPDVYHEVAEKLAFPASVRCKNHDDAWRILALYLDYIRAVNPVEFEKFRMLDSALAVLHDFSYQYPTSLIPNETLALAVVYFLVDFHRIHVNLGSLNRPWYTVLCKNAQFDELERMRTQIEHFLVGSFSDESSENGTIEIERISA